MQATPSDFYITHFSSSSQLQMSFTFVVIIVYSLLVYVRATVGSEAGD